MQITGHRTLLKSKMVLVKPLVGNESTVGGGGRTVSKTVK